MSKSTRTRLKESSARPVKLSTVHAIAEQNGNLSKSEWVLQKRPLEETTRPRRKRKAVAETDMLYNSYPAPKSPLPVVNRMKQKGVRTDHANDRSRSVKLSTSTPLPLYTVTIGTGDASSDQEEGNMLMREWLECKANRGDLPGLQWYDKSRRMVRISWKHGSKAGWTENDSEVYISWAQCTGRYDPESKGGFKRWKANFRCALNSLEDVQEVKEESATKFSNPYKVYRLLDPVSHRRSRRYTSTDSVSSRCSSKMQKSPTASSSMMSSHDNAKTQPVMMLLGTSAISASVAGHSHVLVDHATDPSNPTMPRFAGWLLSNGAPIDGSNSHQLSGDCMIPLDDHSYADSKAQSFEVHCCDEGRVKVETVATEEPCMPCNNVIPTMVEHLSGELSDEDGDRETYECIVESTVDSIKQVARSITSLKSSRKPQHTGTNTKLVT